MIRWRLPLSLAALCVMYLGVNYSWTHAAFAGAVTGHACQTELVESAEDRVAHLFGTVTARPWVYCLDRPGAGLSVEYGTTRFAPLVPAIIILGPRGQNADVASHELAHAELAARTSVLLRTYRVPTWFDEGLAMQVDTRAAFDRNALEALNGKFSSAPLRLSALASPSQFFGRGIASITNYAFSKCVLDAAIADVGLEKILHIALAVNWVSEFPSNFFQPFEAVCRQV